MPRLRPAQLGWFLSEAWQRPPKFLARKAIDAGRQSLRAVVERAGGHPYAPRWCGAAEVAPLLAASEIDRALAILGQRRPAEREEILRRAGRIAEGERRALGVRHGEAPAGSGWHRDIVSGRIWPLEFHTRYAYADLLDRQQASDVKIPWELSRLQHLPVLAFAYRCCGEQRLLRTIVDDVADWRQSNPIGHGVNWVVGMEVAFRAVSLLLTHDLVAGTPGEAGLRDLDLAGLLAAHGRYLYRNPEYSDINGNHYTSCLLGLLVLGLALPAEREAGRWVDMAVRELRSEILAQTYPDGVCHEGSIPYHGLVLELFLAAELLGRRRGVDLGDAYRERLGRMAEFVDAYTKPNGLAPSWGDGDDGRLIALSARPIHDHRSLQTGCAAALGRSGLAAGAEAPGLADVVVLFDADALDALEGFPPEADASRLVESAGFGSGGFYMVRRGADYCLIDCGDVGLRGRGGHGHHDTLSLEVSLAGLDVLTDTGSASYTRSIDDRVLSISAAAHSVAMLDGQEPGRISFARLPHAGGVPFEVLSWDPAEGSFVGRHRGWEPVCYQRGVLMEDVSGRAALLVEDGLSSEPADRVAREIIWRFHFAERWQPCLVDRQVAILEAADGTRVRLAFRLSPDAPPSETSFERVPWFPAYGQRRERWAVRVRRSAGTLPVDATFRLSLEGPGRAPDG